MAESDRTVAARYRANGLLTNFILSALPDEDFERLAPHSETAALAAGETLYRAGENSPFVYFPETCVVSHLCELANGSAFEAAMVGRDGATGLCGAVLGSRPSPHRAEVTVGGNAWRIEAGFLMREFSGGGRLRDLLLDYVNSYLRQITQRAACASFHTADKRLSGWLLMLDDRLRDKEMTLTQEKMAQLMGVNRPSISVAAGSLRNEGSIDYRRGRFSIRDRRKLEAAACECYFSVSENQRNLFSGKSTS